MTMMISDNAHYLAWKGKVDKICKTAFSGMDAECLPDFRWTVCYYSGMQPWDAVNEAVNYWSQDTNDLVEAWDAYIIKGVAYG